MVAYQIYIIFPYINSRFREDRSCYISMIFCCNTQRGRRDLGYFRDFPDGWNGFVHTYTKGSVLSFVLPPCSFSPFSAGEESLGFMCHCPRELLSICSLGRDFEFRSLSSPMDIVLSHPSCFTHGRGHHHGTTTLHSPILSGNLRTPVFVTHNNKYYIISCLYAEYGCVHSSPGVVMGLRDISSKLLSLFHPTCRYVEINDKGCFFLCSTN